MGNTSVVHTLDKKFKDFQMNLQNKDEDIYSLNTQIHDRNNQIQLMKMNDSNSQYQLFNLKEKHDQANKELEKLRREN